MRDDNIPSCAVNLEPHPCILWKTLVKINNEEEK